MSETTWIFPFRLASQRLVMAAQRWSWQADRHMPRNWLLMRAQRFQQNTKELRDV